MTGMFGGESQGQEEAEQAQSQLAKEQADQLAAENAQEESIRQGLEQQRIAALRGKNGAVYNDDPGAGGVQQAPADQNGSNVNADVNDSGSIPGNLDSKTENQLGFGKSPGVPAAGAGGAVPFPTPAQGQAKNLFNKIMGR